MPSPVLDFVYSCDCEIARLAVYSARSVLKHNPGARFHLITMYDPDEAVVAVFRDAGIPAASSLHVTEAEVKE
jgi:hypothetical protein